MQGLRVRPSGEYTLCPWQAYLHRPLRESCNGFAKDSHYQIRRRISSSHMGHGKGYPQTPTKVPLWQSEHPRCEEHWY